MKIKQEDLAEFKGQIVDLFEDYLSEHDVKLESADRDAAIEDGEDPEELGILYGDLYDAIGDPVDFALQQGGGEIEVHLAALMGFADALKMGKSEHGVKGSDLVALNQKLQDTIAAWAKNG